MATPGRRMPKPPVSGGMVAYDPVVIQAFADALYRLADRIVLIYTIIGALLGGAFGMAVMATMDSGLGIVAVLLGLGIGGYIGHSRGLAKTFQLRLEAQLALCQVEIELNTRNLQHIA